MQTKVFTAKNPSGEAGSCNVRSLMDLIVNYVARKTHIRLKKRVQGLDDMNYCLFGVGNAKYSQEIQNYRQIISANYKNPEIFEMLLDAGAKVESLRQIFSDIRMQIPKYLITDDSIISIITLNGKEIHIEISYRNPENTNFDELFKNLERSEIYQKLATNNKSDQVDYEAASGTNQSYSCPNTRDSFQLNTPQPSSNYLEENKNLELLEPFQKQSSDNKFDRFDDEDASNTSQSDGWPNMMQCFQSNALQPSNTYFKENSMQEEIFVEDSKNQDKSIDYVNSLNVIKGELYNIIDSANKINNIIALFQKMKAAGNKPNDGKDRDPDPFIRIMNSLSSSIHLTPRGEKMKSIDDENMITYKVEETKEEIQADYAKENKDIGTTVSGRPFVPEKTLSRSKKKSEEGTKPETRADNNSYSSSSEDKNDQKHNRQNLANKGKKAIKKNVKTIISLGYDPSTRGETNPETNCQADNILSLSSSDKKEDDQRQEQKRDLEVSDEQKDLSFKRSREDSLSPKSFIISDAAYFENQLNEFSELETKREESNDVYNSSREYMDTLENERSEIKLLEEPVSLENIPRTQFEKEKQTLDEKIADLKNAELEEQKSNTKTFIPLKLRVDSIKTRLNFIDTLYKILEEKDYSEHISWSSDGLAIVIKKPTEFAESVLPVYFDYNKFPSFLRQLSFYNFKRQRRDSDHCVYYHPMFLKGRIDLLGELKRERSWKKQKPCIENTSKETSYHEKSILYYKLLKKCPNILPDLKDVFKPIRKVQENISMKQENIFKMIKYCNKAIKVRAKQNERKSGAVIYYILAAKCKNAGKCYNPSTFIFPNAKIAHIDNGTTPDVKKLFVDFCNRNIPIMLKQKECIKLQLNKDKNSILKVDVGPDLVLENLHNDEFGDFSIYSVIQREKHDPKKEAVVDMKLIDSIWTENFKRDSKGHRCLNVIGDKHAPVVDSGASDTRIKENRERGHFEKMIPLRSFDKQKLTKDPSEVKKNGVVHWLFEFDSKDD